MATFEVNYGSVVRLKSGGPKMTVEGIREVFEPVHITYLNLCWFNADGNLQHTLDVPKCLLDESVDEFKNFGGHAAE